MSGSDLAPESAAPLGFRELCSEFQLIVYLIGSDFTVLASPSLPEKKHLYRSSVHVAYRNPYKLLAPLVAILIMTGANI